MMLSVLSWTSWLPGSGSNHGPGVALWKRDDRACTRLPDRRAGRTQFPTDLRALHGAIRQNRLGQQHRVGRVGNVGRDDGGATLILVMHGTFASAAFASRPRSNHRLRQRGSAWCAPSAWSMRHRLVATDTAELAPGDRVRHLPTQRLVAQPAPEFEVHHAQMYLHRLEGRPRLGSKNGRKGVKHTGSSNKHIDRANWAWSWRSSSGKIDSHHDGLSPTAQHERSLAQGFQTILPGQSLYSPLD